MNNKIELGMIVNYVISQSDIDFLQTMSQNVNSLKEGDSVEMKVYRVVDNQNTIIGILSLPVPDPMRQVICYKDDNKKPGTWHWRE